MIDSLRVVSLQRQFHALQARHAAALDRGDAYTAGRVMEQMRAVNIEIACLAREQQESK